MVSANEYYQVIEEIRQNKGMPVSDLCQDIISDRTYYRNLANKGNIRYDILSQLSKRLGFTAEDLIHFAVFVRRGDPSITRFIYRVHLKHFDDIVPIEEKVRQHEETSETYKILIDAYLMKYKYLCGEFTKEDYSSKLSILANKALKHGLTDIFVASVLTLYVCEVKDQTLIDLTKLIQYLNGFEFRNNIIFYVITVDLMLEYLVDQRPLLEKPFIDTLAHFSKALTFFPHKYFHMKYALYLAYEAKLQNNEETMVDLLFKYLMHLNMIIGNKDYHEAINHVSLRFGIDPIAFMQKISKERLMQAPFVIHP